MTPVMSNRPREGIELALSDFSVLLQLIVGKEWNGRSRDFALSQSLNRKRKRPFRLCMKGLTQSIFENSAPNVGWMKSSREPLMNTRQCSALGVGWVLGGITVRTSYLVTPCSGI